MKKIISYLGIYIVLHGMYLIQGCCRSKTCESVSGIEAFYLNNNEDSLSSGDTVVYNMAKILINPITFGTNCMKPNTWINSVYAFSCREDYSAMTNFEKMEITATEDYNTTHPSGTLLNELFEVTKTSNYFSPYAYEEGLGSLYTLQFNTPPDSNMLLNIKVAFYYEHFEHPFVATLPQIYLKK